MEGKCLQEFALSSSENPFLEEKYQALLSSGRFETMEECFFENICLHHPENVWFFLNPK